MTNIEQLENIKIQIKQLEKQKLDIDKDIEKLKKSLEAKLQKLSESMGYALVALDPNAVKLAKEERKKLAAKAKSEKSSKRTPAKVKYRDEQGNTWTGRGIRPRWLSTALSEGKSIDSFLV